MLRKFIFAISLLPILCLSAQDFNAEIVTYKTDISIEKGKLLTKCLFEIKINNRGGERYTKVSIPYSKMISVSNIDAYLKDSHGAIIKKLKKNEIDTRSDISNISLYDDSFVKEFTLKHNSYPYSICYSYQQKEEQFMSVVYWSPLVFKQIPTLQATLNLSCSKGNTILYSGHLVNDFSSDTNELGINYHWTASYDTILPSELFSPSPYDFLPSVSIVPQEFYYEKQGSFKTWQLFGNWQEELLEDISELPLSEQEKINELTEGIDNEFEIIKILYHYLQDQTRYISVNIETGGYKPYPASYVSENKFGDCKALANYFKSVLQFANITSYYTLINAGEQIEKIDTSLPSPQFNHAILCVPLETDTIWLDCTSNGPFNYLGTFTQNRYALVISKNSQFVKTPAMAKYDVLETRTIKVSSTNQNEVIVNFKNTYKGDGFESLNYLQQNYNASKKEEIIRNYIIEDGFDPIGFSVIEQNRDSLDITLVYEAKNTSLYKNYGKETLIQILPFAIEKLEAPRRRKLPVQIDYPIYKIDSIEYIIPVEKMIASCVDNQSIQSAFGEYKIEIQNKEDKILVIKSIFLNAGSYLIDQYAEFYAFMDEITQIDNSYIVIINK